MLLLTPEQQQQVLHKLDQFWPKPRICPICKNESWRMQQRIFGHLIYDTVSATPMPNSSSTGFQQEVFPVLLFHCHSCGYIATFMASTLGIEVGTVTLEIPKPKEKALQSDDLRVWPPPPKRS